MVIFSRGTEPAIRTNGAAFCSSKVVYACAVHRSTALFPQPVLAVGKRWRWYDGNVVQFEGLFFLPFVQMTYVLDSDNNFVFVFFFVFVSLYAFLGGRNVRICYIKRDSWPPNWRGWHFWRFFSKFSLFEKLHEKTDKKTLRKKQDNLRINDIRQNRFRFFVVILIV